MRDLRSIMRLAALAAFLPLVWGCFKYKETITIEQSGRGTVEIAASIPEKTASGNVYYDNTKITGDTVPAPVPAGAIDQMLLGGKGVRVVSKNVELVDGFWEYNVKIEFTSIDDLARTKYFKGRNMTVTFVGGKQMKFSQTLRPTIIDSAREQAKLTPGFAYSAPFLNSVDDAEWLQKTAGRGTLSYGVIMPGINATAEPSGQGKIEGRPDNTTGASWEYTYSDFLPPGTLPTLGMTVDLPAEKGFMPVVVILLLASIAGILVPAARLLMIKSRRSS